MVNKVFLFNYPNSGLPSGRDAIMDWAETETERLTGKAAGQVIHFIEESNLDPEHRLTISVSEDDVETLAALQAGGAKPKFEEPREPYAEGNEITLPGSFQALNFGRRLHPGTIQDNPAQLEFLAMAVNNAIPDMPKEARDWSNWIGMEHDDETGTFTIFWEEPDGESC